MESMDFDILIIQECEKLKQDYFPNCKYFWTGRNERKGLGVIIKNKTSRISNYNNPNLINFLPIETDQFNILGIWSFNHRASKFGNEVSGNTIDAIKYYDSWLRDKSKPCIVGGDFNNSLIWDKPKKSNNLENINRELEELGFKSSYHVTTGDSFGEEQNPTFFHTKNKLKKYHIDYIYLKSLKVESLEVGKYSDWIKLSDHVPMIVNVSEFKQ